MTRDEIVSFVCGKIGLTDAQSLALCAEFVNRRYQMIYDREDWLDAMGNVTAATTASDPMIDLPATLERITKIQFQGGELIEPVDQSFIMETDPGSFTATGTPKFYSEFRSLTLGTNQIRLFPIPDKVYKLFIRGKRVFTSLTADQAPVLRNIDNALIAFAEFDMLQRLRQFDKAQVKLQEASAALQLMADVEKQRANVPRISKHLTVSGDSLGEMTDAVACRIGDYTPGTRIKIQEHIRRNYLELYDSQLWPESRQPVQLDRDGAEIVLPEYIDRVIEIRENTNNRTLGAVEESLYWQIAPEIFEQSGAPIAFSVLPSVGVAVLPPSIEPLSFVSDSDSDIGDVFVSGESGGVIVRETVTLNGMNQVDSKYIYDVPLTVAKGLTAGTVTVTGKDSGTFLVQLFPDERERKHVRVWLQPTPSSTQGSKCLILGKRRIRPLMTDEDTPMLSGIGTTLINMATADIMEMGGNKDAATAMRLKAQTSIQTVVDRELKQTAYEPRIVPYAEPNGYTSGWDFGTSLFSKF